MRGHPAPLVRRPAARRAAPGGTALHNREDRRSPGQSGGLRGQVPMYFSAFAALAELPRIGVYDIQTIDGHYLTAVDGGGRTSDTIHSDATRVGAWEKFTVSCGH